MARSPWLVVAGREFHERVRTRWFVIVTVLGPVAMIALTVLPAWLGKRQADRPVVIEVLDRSGRDVTAVMNQTAVLFGGTLEARAVPADTSEAALRDHIQAQATQGYLILPADVLTGGEALYRGDNASSLGFGQRLLLTLNTAAIRLRARDAGLDEARVLALQRPVEIDFKQTTGDGQVRSATGSLVVGYIIAVILQLAIMFYAVNVMRSVMLDKTSRVVELVASAVRPRQLIAGKLVGVGAVGLLQLGIWAAGAIVMLRYQDVLLGLFGIDSGSGLSLPDLGPDAVVLVLLYFVGGYFFYAALYGAIGAMVNSDQEAQQAQMPISLLLFVPMVCLQVVAGDPRGAASVVLGALPFSSPVLMPMRYVLGGAGALDLAVSLAVLALSIVAVLLVASRIYRVGILMYGKRPTLRELGRWLTYR